MPSKTEGRMIKKSLSNSQGFSRLKPESAVLFCMIIPHLSAHGKLNGGLGFIKDEVCPRITYISLKNLKCLLLDISEHTNLKWFEKDGRFFLHATNFLRKHQNLDKNKLGKDQLPSYSGVTPDQLSTNSGVTPELLHHEVKIREGKRREEKDGPENRSSAPPLPSGGGSDSASAGQNMAAIKDDPMIKKWLKHPKESLGIENL